MKKFSVFIILLSACMFFAKAQQIFDNFESYDPFTVDPSGIWTYYDGDGGSTFVYANVTAPNIPYIGSCIVMNPTMTNPDITSSQSAYSGNQFLSIINAASVTTNDWIISPEMPTVSSGTLTFYARELTTEYGAEIMRVLYSTTDANPSSFTTIQQVNVSSTTWASYSYSIPAGAKYVAINCISYDKFALFLDDISISYTTNEAAIATVPSSTDFGTVRTSESATSTVSVTGYNLSANITASTTAPYSVSTDGTTFSSSVSLSATGGTLYVKYAPTANGINNGIVTLTSGTATCTVALTGKGVDCSSARNVPYSFDFNLSDDEIYCWQAVDANNDDFTFYVSGNMAIYSYNTDAAANDWLISPSISLLYNSTASFKYHVGHWDSDNNYAIIPETFGVYVIPEGESNAIQVLAPQSYSDTVWTTLNIDLSAYDGQTVRVAIHVTSPADMFRVYIDDFYVNGEAAPTLTCNVTDIDFGRLRVGATREEVAVLTSTHLNAPIDVVTTAPYKVSIDGINYATTVTIPANPATEVDDILYIQFAPDEVGSYTEITTASTAPSTLTVSITMKGTAFECDTITNFTFTEDFAAISQTRECWDIEDANSDNATFTLENGVAQYVGHATNVANDKLLSPVIALTGNQLLTFDYRTPSTQTGKFSVAAINSDTVIALTELIEATNNTFTTQTIDIRDLDGAYRIAFHCVSDTGTASLEIDNVTIRNIDEPFIHATPTSMSFSCMVNETTEAQTAEVTSWALTENITVHTSAPFEISLDGTDFRTDTSIVVTGLESSATLYVRYHPTAEGSYTGAVTLTSGTTTASITLNGITGSAEITANPNTMTFTTTVGEVTTAQTSAITGANLLEDITVSTAAPFEISLDGTTFGATATITVTDNAANATLYVRYNPDTEGTHSGTVNLVSGSANATITLNGTAEPIDTIGISENTGRIIAIYPNPASTVLNVEAEGYDQLQIVNVVGQVVYKANITGRTQVNVSSFSNGVYFVRLTNATGTATQKFIKR